MISSLDYSRPVMNNKSIFMALVGLLVVSILCSACRKTAPSQRSQQIPSPTITSQSSPASTRTPTPFPPTPTPIPAVRIESGERALFNGDWDTALAEFELAQAASPDPKIQAAALLGIARVRWMERNDYEATAALQKLLNTYPEAGETAEAQFLMGQILNAQERYSDAVQAYTSYLDLRPGLIDAYILDQRGDAAFAAGDYNAAIKDFQGAQEAPSQLDTTFLRMKTARAYALAGDHPTALTLYDDLYNSTSDGNTRALIDLRKGEIYTALGQTADANAAYQDAVQNYTTSYNAYPALVALLDSGIVVDELQRGIVDYFAGEYGVALAAFDRYLQSNPADPGTAQYYYALTSRKMGEYETAIKRWDIVIQQFPDHPYWDDAWDQKAYTQWAYLDQYDTAIQTLLNFVQQASGHPRAAEFLYDAALTAERGDKLEQAFEIWERVAREYPNSEQAPRALFLAGITHYRLGNYFAALDAFQRFQPIAPTLDEKTAAELWTGKAQLASGDDTSARASWEKAAAIDPTAYYSLRARDLLYGRAPFEPPEGYDLVFDAQSERTKAEAWMRTTFALPEDINLADPAPLVSNPVWQRAVELFRLGLTDEARSEFESLRQTTSAEAAQSYRLANELVALGAYRSTILSARQVLDIAGMDDAGTLNAPIYFNHLRFGSFYSDLIMPLAQKYSFHPLFLFSLVRQESLFDSAVRSAADARGLMQIMPATGREIASDLGWPDGYTADDLYRPIVNLTFGVDYLSEQRDLFDGDLYAALAAYNGGPQNALEWHQLAPDDPDLFLEVIRYAETRDYIRKVYELFNLYRIFYNRTP
jgi:soluble lytic murein transglycosylase